MQTRREFIELSALAALSSVFPWSTPPRTGAPLRILLLGGTGFLGPYFVHSAHARGHKVSMLNRGQREPGLFESEYAQVEALRGDRTLPTAYDSLKGRTWDAVIDTA